MGDLTENFSSSEFECQCAEDCVAKNPAMQMDADFMKKLQTLREVYGGSLRVTSGIRCENVFMNTYDTLGKVLLIIR